MEKKTKKTFLASSKSNRLNYNFTKNLITLINQNLMIISILKTMKKPILILILLVSIAISCKVHDSALTLNNIEATQNPNNIESRERIYYLTDNTADLSVFSKDTIQLNKTTANNPTIFLSSSNTFTYSYNIEREKSNLGAGEISGNETIRSEIIEGTWESEDPDAYIIIESYDIGKIRYRIINAGDLTYLIKEPL